MAKEIDLETDCTLISSQKYVDLDIVSSKIENNDFDCIVSPVFEIDGRKFRILTDGHHALHAARESGNDPVYYEQSKQEDDRICLLESGNVDDFLTVNYNDCDYYSIETGMDVF